MLNEMYVERGSKEDWIKLHHLHYKSAEKSDGAPSIWRCIHGDNLVGVIMMSSPDILCRERHMLFPSLKPTGKETVAGNKARMDLHINRHFMRITRTVTSTMYRGCGAGYRMINLASRMEGKKYIEIVSAMSRYNLFVEKSGFVTVPAQKSTSFDKVSDVMRQYFITTNLQDVVGLNEEYNEMNVRYQKVVLERMQDLYFSISAREKTGGNRLNTVETVVRQMSFKRVMSQIQQIAFTLKKYGVYKNPDFERTDIPQKLALTCFDEQSTDENLIIRCNNMSILT
jgi:ABC-type ATPase with predicted acetyltransferase domain